MLTNSFLTLFYHSSAILALQLKQIKLRAKTLWNAMFRYRLKVFSRIDGIKNVKHLVSVQALW